MVHIKHLCHNYELFLMYCIGLEKIQNEMKIHIMQGAGDTGTYSHIVQGAIRHTLLCTRPRTVNYKTNWVLKMCDELWIT